MAPQYLLDLGIEQPNKVYANLSPAELVEEAVKRGQGILAANGAISVDTGEHTGRSPRDKYVVRRPATEGNIWWGKVNAGVTPDVADRLLALMAEHLRGQDLFVVDATAGADPDYALPVRVITPYAWQGLFARNLFRREQTTGKDEERFTVLVAPKFHAPAEELGLKSSTAVVLDFEKRLVLICGTEYAGEIKKSIFTVMNYEMPLRGVLPMHCSANVGQDGDVALFFGLSGTGKTSLSADPERGLIGDDEHVWTDDATFNVEGGCYAKCIKLSEEKEPDIYHAIKFGSVLENLVLDAKRYPDYNDGSKTENTRVAYPLDYIANAVPGGRGAAPSAVIFLTADAFGVLPPISMLTPEQAMYHFLNGYTAKLAGTEKGLGKEPEATFSSCFGQPFLPLAPEVYANMLAQKLEKTGVPVYLVNTGWSGGPYGVGERMDIRYTRAMVRAALNGSLKDADTFVDPVFGLRIPCEVAGVPNGVLNPRDTWTDKNEYDVQARALAQRFERNHNAIRGVLAEPKPETAPV
ncbi:MAG TPA: phosphoenolpyruvate carboxykinase (ATP) [Armatimonadota bacterium]|jgi:phosphoenolpyruvate carboxykinase (ATP)